MNLYIRALGFAQMDTKLEEIFIQESIKHCVKDGFVLKHDGFKRGVIIVQISSSTGIYIYGRYEGKKFIYEYYFPFLMGSRITENDELTFERHLDKESFAVVCDEEKTGVTIIFYLQNIYDYLEYLSKTPKFDYKEFSLDRKNEICKHPLKKMKTVLTALSLGGMILLPTNRTRLTIKKDEAIENKRRKLIAAAKNGDEEAIESLTIEDIDMYTKVSNRIMSEDVFSIVDSTFMPCGVECDQYSVVGEILEFTQENNMYTDEIIYIMTLDCNNMIFTMAVNKLDVMGEPAVGRRFKGQIWLQGNVKFNE